jgi:hypothetical protein
MAHFAQLDEQNNIITTVKVDDNNCLDENGQESEAVGIAYLQNLLGGTWIQTSINNRIRGTYAYPGGKYHPDIDKFEPPKQADIASWTWDFDLQTWKPPFEPEYDGVTRWVWSEAENNWIVVS